MRNGCCRNGSGRQWKGEGPSSSSLGLGRNGCRYNVGVFAVNAFIGHFLLERSDSRCIPVLNGERLIAEPGQSVFATTDHLGLLADPSNPNAILGAASVVASRQGQQLAYDANTWAAELADAETRYGRAVEAVILWASASSGWLAMRLFPLE